MNVPQQKQQKGFTIIEVILVLAIAGLIFLMVFLALPALQRGQRDTQRKDDLSRLASAVQNYQSANRGSVPAASAAGITNAGGLVPGYLTKGGDTFNDPHTGVTYTFIYGLGAAPTTEGQIRYATQAQCSGTNIVNATAGGTNQFAASVYLEGGAGYCVDNH